MSEKIKEGSIAHLQGMTMELSEAANNLPEGQVLHWHTELDTVEEGDKPADDVQKTGNDEPVDKMGEE